MVMRIAGTTEAVEIPVAQVFEPGQRHHQDTRVQWCHVFEDGAASIASVALSAAFDTCCCKSYGP